MFHKHDNKTNNSIQLEFLFVFGFECNNKCFKFLLPEWLCFPFVARASERGSKRLMIRYHIVTIHELKPQVDRIIQVASLIRDTSLMGNNSTSIFLQIA